eukprot:11724727-Karenia_brevis.AAC.1
MGILRCCQIIDNVGPFQILHLNYGFCQSNGPITVPKMENEMLTMSRHGMTNCNNGMVAFMIAL